MTYFSARDGLPRYFCTSGCSRGALRITLSGHEPFVVGIKSPGHPQSCFISSIKSCEHRRRDRGERNRAEGMPGRAAASCKSWQWASAINSACRRPSLIKAAIFTRSNPSCSGASKKMPAPSGRLASEPCPLLIELSLRLGQVEALCGLQPMRLPGPQSTSPSALGYAHEQPTISGNRTWSNPGRWPRFTPCLSVGNRRSQRELADRAVKPQVRRIVSAIANTGSRLRPISAGSGVRVPDGAPNRRSSLKERDRSRVVAGPSSWPSTRPVGAPTRRRGQGSGGARPRSGRGALTPSPFGACCAVVEGLVVGLFRGCVACGGRGSHQGRCVPVGAGVVAARSSLRRVIGRQVIAGLMSGGPRRTLSAAKSDVG